MSNLILPVHVAKAVQKKKKEKEKEEKELESCTTMQIDILTVLGAKKKIG